MSSDAKTAVPPVPLRPLGATGMKVPALGVGTNRWGLAATGADAVLPVFHAALDLGAGLFDTAELYQFGGSERAIGGCLKREPRPAFVVTKFAPYPARVSGRSVLRALEASLERLGALHVGLYLIHFPFTLIGIDAVMDAFAGAVRAGLAKAVGVSNFNARQTRAAAARLAKHGVPLAANEVHYSLFHRKPERNGVLEACRELDVACIAYRPLAGGRFQRKNPRLSGALEAVARAHGKTAAQAALNWLLGKNERVIAIPGTTNPAHLRENLGAVGWSLEERERATLEAAAGE